MIIHWSPIVFDTWVGWQIGPRPPSQPEPARRPPMPTVFAVVATIEVAALRLEPGSVPQSTRRAHDHPQDWEITR